MGKKIRYFKNYKRFNHWLFKRYDSDYSIVIQCPLCNKELVFNFWVDEPFPHCPYCTKEIDTKYFIAPKEHDEELYYQHDEKLYYLKKPSDF